MDPIQSAMASLRTQRDQIDIALAALERLSPTGANGTHVVPTDRPTDRPRTKPSRNGARPPGRSAGPDDSAGSLAGRLTELLREGVSKPGELTAKSKASVFVVRNALKALIKSGVVRVEGTTMSRRYYLAKGKSGRAPAKEEPSRGGPEEHVE